MINIKKLLRLTIALGVVITNAGALNATEILGAGATFPYPLYSKMFDSYHKEFNVKVNYQAIGSGGGIRQLKSKTVDFGASDAFMSDKSLKAAKKEILHVPICLGAVSMVYNLPGSPQLKLTPEIVSGIFLGEIKNWNDKAIQAVNPKTQLPKMKIVSVHRSDGSGTTFIFSDYLSKISPTWAEKVGRGKSINWPSGLGSKGNAGVAGLVKQIPGSIGYVELAYAHQNKMNVAALKNKSGLFITPSLDAISDAANVIMPKDTRVSITNTDAKNGYAISGFTWVLVYKDQSYNRRNENQARATRDLLGWMISEGQRFAKPLLYAPLPDSVVKKAKKIISTLHFEGREL
ncbi:MAG: phosphate transport system substrate-binding protein [Candidatus Marinamargulisbacteria bacterium]|jgi:phosphate transport system substrate-binding protein